MPGRRWSSSSASPASGRKKIVKIVDGDEVEMLPGDVQSILESQKMDVGILSDFFVQTLLERR